MNGLRLRYLIVVGHGKIPARLDFSAGLNVIWGAANTGKTHVLSLIDFALGASSPPESPPEQLGYEGVMLGFETLDKKSWTLCRSLQGGDIRKIEGLVETWPTEGIGEILSATHRATNSLSKFLLGLLNMTNIRLRKNAKGDQQDLSFRNLAHLVIVPEGKIQSEVSPVETGQFVSKTVEFSLFKYLVTGVDDSTIQAADRQRRDKNRVAAQLELIDMQIADAEQSVKFIGEDRDELTDQYARLDSSISQTLTVWQNTTVDYYSLAAKRREVRQQRETLLDRNDEIDLLITRFTLLDTHYDSDLARLEAIEEAGSLFAALDEGPCPFCGANAVHQRENSTISCEGDVEGIRRAASAEIEKIRLKKRELNETVSRLHAERIEIGVKTESISQILNNLQNQIQTEIPDVQNVRTRINEFVAAKEKTQGLISRFDNIDRLKNMRTDIVGDDDIDSVSLIAQGGIDTVILDKFSMSIEKVLSSWDLGKSRVFFDLSKRDIQIDGKARRINGKGVRAVFHAAFSLALMQFTADENKPHTRFVALDSPLVTYRDPLQADDIALSRSNLSSRFYDLFKEWDENLQVIILENRDPPKWLEDQANIIRFTGSPDFGRAGFYYLSS